MVERHKVCSYRGRVFVPFCALYQPPPFLNGARGYWYIQRSTPITGNNTTTKWRLLVQNLICFSETCVWAHLVSFHHGYTFIYLHHAPTNHERAPRWAVSSRERTLIPRLLLINILLIISKFAKWQRTFLLSLTRSTCPQEQFGVTQTKSNLDFIILNKINNLYKEAISKFQNDIRFWNAYIDFSKHHFPNNISHILHRMVQVHRDKPKCWQIAACWELAMNNNKPNARQYLLRGLLIHPDSQLLYIDAFKLELDDRLATASTNAENAESQEDNSASVMMNDTEMPLSLERAYFIYQQAYDRMNDTGMPLSLERAYFIYQQASDRIKDIKFIIQLINIANEYNDTDKLQKNIIEEMLDKYIEEPLMWDYLARRELQDLMRPLLTPTELENAKHMSLRKRIMCCNQVYQIAMEKIKTKKMWTLYIDCLWEINRDGRSLPNFRRNLLNRALKKAHQAKKLKQGHYLSWIEMLISEIQRETESEEGNTETLNDNRKREGARKQLEELLCGAIEAVDI